MAATLVKHPDARLRKPAARVQSVTRQLQERCLVLLDAMRFYKGVGLAAVQIGWDARVFCVNPTGDPADDLVCINPHSLILFGADVWDEETCLSLPGETCRVSRSEKVTLKSLDVEGVEQTTHAQGFLARIIQHEVDHLNSLLIIDKRTE